MNISFGWCGYVWLFGPGCALTCMSRIRCHLLDELEERSSCALARWGSVGVSVVEEVLWCLRPILGVHDKSCPSQCSFRLDFGGCPSRGYLSYRWSSNGRKSPARERSNPGWRDGNCLKGCLWRIRICTSEVVLFPQMVVLRADGQRDGACLQRALFGMI